MFDGKESAEEGGVEAEDEPLSATGVMFSQAHTRWCESIPSMVEMVMLVDEWRVVGMRLTHVTDAASIYRSFHHLYKNCPWNTKL